MAKETKKKRKTKKLKIKDKAKKTKKRRWFRRKRKEVEQIPDHRIDLDEIIKVDSFALNNTYDQKTVLYVLNKKNKLHLTMDDVVFDTFDEHKARLRAKNVEKYKGSKTIYYEQAKNVGYIVWLIISIIVFFASIAVLFPVGLVGNAGGSWQKAGEAILIASAPVGVAGFVSVLVCILCWRGEVSLGKLQTVESKAEHAKEKQDEVADAQVQLEVDEETVSDFVKKTP